MEKIVAVVKQWNGIKVTNKLQKAIENDKRKCRNDWSQSKGKSMAVCSLKYLPSIAEGLVGASDCTPVIQYGKWASA